MWDGVAFCYYFAFGGFRYFMLIFFVQFEMMFKFVYSKVVLPSQRQFNMDQRELRRQKVQTVQCLQGEIETKV